MLDGTDELRGSVPFNRFYGTIARFVQPEALTEVMATIVGGESPVNPILGLGLAGVWAEENTRNLSTMLSSAKRRLPRVVQG